jgi:hypothetical protein
MKNYLINLLELAPSERTKILKQAKIFLQEQLEQER